MAITVAEVERVALLARLRHSPAEVEGLTSELARVVAYVDQLAQVDTEGVEPMVHAVELTNVLRDDVVTASLDRDTALGNAPARNEVGFLVPPVLGE